MGVSMRCARGDGEGGGLTGPTIIESSMSMSCMRADEGGGGGGGGAWAWGGAVDVVPKMSSAARWGGSVVFAVE